MSGTYVYDSNRQIDGSYIGEGRGLYICNMDYAAADMVDEADAPGTLGLVVAGANITAAADILGDSKACVLNGTAYMTSDSFPLIGSNDYSLSIAVYFSDWSTVAADSTIFSQMDVAGDNGMRLYLKDDQTLHLIHTSGGTDTLDLSEDISGIDAGWHVISVIVERGTAQNMFIDGASVDTATDAADGIGTPTAATDTISGISNAAAAVITCTAGHGLSTGDLVTITGVIGNNGTDGTLYDLHGMDTLNGNTYVITVTAADKFTIPINTVNFDTWSSGGTVTYNAPQPTVIGAHADGSETLTGRVDARLFSN